MKKATILFFFVLFGIQLFSQNFDWVWQNPKPQGNTLRTVTEITPGYWLSLGAAGVIMGSTDNGDTWYVGIADSLGREFRGLYLVNALVGYICGEEGLLMKTTDGGQSAQYLNPGTVENLMDVAFVDADTGYVVGAVGTILKTTDGGATWNSITSSITNTINTVSVVSADMVVIGSASTSKALKSTDYGASWVDITPAGLTQSIWDIFFLNSSTGWLAAQNSGKVYRTTDGGTSWAESTTNSLVVPNFVKFKDANVGFVTNNNNGNVFKSTDGGATWTAYSASPEPQYAVGIGSSAIISVGRSGSIHKTIDEGLTYNQITEAITFTQIRSLKFIDNLTGIGTAGSTTTADSLGFLIKTTDGGQTWNDVGYNFKNIVYSLSTPTPLVWYVGRGRNAIFKTTDGGLTFNQQTQPLTGTSNFNDIGFADENNGYAFSAGGGIIKTHDGTNWVTANTPFGTTTVYSGQVFNAGKVIAVGGSAKAYMTLDSGATWIPLTTNIPGNYFVVRFLNDTIGVIAGYNSPSPVASKTTDGGLTWTALTLPVEFEGNSIWGVGFKDENKFWLSGINGALYYTLDGGTTWNTTDVVTANTLYSIAIVDNDLWISGSNGTILKGFSDPEVPVELISFDATVSANKVTLVWKTATEQNNKGFEVERKLNGENWTSIGFVHGKGTTSETSVYSFSDNLTRSSKAWYRLKQQDFNGSYEYSKIVEVNLSLPTKFDLAQNYPNPFNPTTSIKYSLAAKSMVELKIYNILGKEIVKLVNDVQDAGNYEVKFNAQNLSSGVYFYELNAGSFSAKKKMMLIK
ncbi:MAG: T9SS type A sorting domain-containing protein [Ignavibacteriaceae bacterium]|nr:T9SS type A sorting domain-containing protein [Ignavibacteriaceae bacterium]